MKKRITVLSTLVIITLSGFSVVVAEESLDKYVIVNPYEGVDWNTVNHVKSALHTHTSNSGIVWNDSMLNAPDLLIAAYERAGFGALVLTDHDYVSYPWDGGGNPSSHVNAPGSPLLTMPGNELSKKTHTLSYGTMYRDMYDPGNVRDQRGSAGFDKNVVNIGNEPNVYGGTGGIVYFSHPRRSDPDELYKDKDEHTFFSDLWWAEKFTSYRAARGIEVLNCGQFSKNHSERLWDAILSKTMPDRPVWGTASDDNHGVTSLDPDSRLGVGYTLVLLSDAQQTSQGLFDALGAGRTYFSTHKMVNNITGSNDDGKLRPETPQPKIHSISIDNDAKTITVVCDYASKVEWISGTTENNSVSRVIKTDENIGGGNSAALFTATLDVEAAQKAFGHLNGYVRFRIIGDGGQTHAQPFALKPGTNDTQSPLTGGLTCYVSPKGSDSNPGTFEKPWKSARKAANTAEAGATVIFEDGEYYEDDVTQVLNSGEEGAPITFKARNKHEATLIYPESTNTTPKFRIRDKKYINVQDLVFTQVTKHTTNTYDILLHCSGSRYCNITGNKFYNAFEEGIKVNSLSSNILIEGNTIIGTDHEGIDALNVTDVIIRYNEIIDAGRVGIMVKGGARNTLVYNNYVHNETRPLSYGFTVGGATNNTSPIDIAKDTGFEAYSLVFYNNVVYSATPGLIRAAFGFLGVKEGHAYNNVIIGATEGFRFESSPGLKNGWEWDPPNINPVVKNNMLVDCSNAYNMIDQPQNPVISNNLFFNTPAVMEPGSISADPMFVDIKRDWHLKKGSPAIGAGVAMPSEIVGFNGAKVKIDLVDYAGEPRTAPWDMGIYNVIKY